MALCWPLQFPPKAKAVLISLADNANDEGHCWPSIPTIAERTCLSPRSVIRAIQELEAFGILTADRTNGRHTSYFLSPASYQQPVPTSHQCQPDTGATQTTTSANLTRDQCQPDTGPVTGCHSNRKEPSSNRKEPSELSAILGKIDSQLLADFRKVRAKMKVEITLTAMRGFEREAQKAGMTLEQAIRVSTENSWRGFKAEWIKPESRGAVTAQTYKPERPRTPDELAANGARAAEARAQVDAAAKRMTA